MRTETILKKSMILAPVWFTVFALGGDGAWARCGSENGPAAVRIGQERHEQLRFAFEQE